MQDNLVSVRDRLANLENEVKLTRHQITGLSRRVEDAINLSTDEET